MSLEGCRILVVEDDYLIAQDVAATLAGAGATVIGPAASVTKALLLLGGETRVGGAVLDVNLGRESSFPVAQALESENIPFLFSTGYNSADIPTEWAHVPVAMKPFKLASLKKILEDRDMG